jgi:hypothetical protein
MIDLLGVAKPGFGSLEQETLGHAQKPTLTSRNVHP